MSALPQANSLKRDAAYVYSAYFIRYLSVLTLVPYYGRVLGPASYGKVLAAMSLMGIVWMVVNYGFSMIGTRDLSSTKDDALHGAIFGRQLAARLILMPFGVAIGAIGTLASPMLCSDPWFGTVATLIGLVNAMNLGWFYQGVRNFRLSLAFEAISYLLNVLFILLLVRSEKDGLYALMGLLASTSIVAVSSYIVALRHLKPRTLAFTGGIREIRDASTLFIQSVHSMLMTSGSTYLLSVLSSPQQVGYFGFVERVISFALAFLAPAGQVLMPTIVHRTKHAPDQVRSLVRKGLFFELGYGVCACLGGLVLAPYIIALALGPRFGASVPMMRIMVCALPFAAFTHAFGLYVLIPQTKEKWLVLAVTSGSLLNLALIAIITHGLGGIGVSIARVAGECMTALSLIMIYINIRRCRTSSEGVSICGEPTAVQRG
jgi:O-antigen/teichoic acid export membrane protein